MRTGSASSLLMGEEIDDEDLAPPPLEEQQPAAQPQSPPLSRRTSSGESKEHQSPPLPGRPPKPVRNRSNGSQEHSPARTATNSSPDHRRIRSDISDVSVDDVSPGHWDQKSVADAISSSVETTKEPSAKTTISFADMNSATSPVEDEAETHILKAIEHENERVRTRPGQNILPGVPAEGISAFEREDSNAAIKVTGLNRFKAAVQKVQDQNVPTNNKLAGLTNAMRMLNEDCVVIQQTDSKSVGNCSGLSSSTRELRYHDDPEVQKVPESNAAALAQNANALFRRTGTERVQGLYPVEEEGDVEEGVGETTGDEDDLQEKGKKRHFMLTRKVMTRTGHAMKKEIASFSNFVEPKKATILTYIKVSVGFFIAPLIITSSILFYAAGNPDLGLEGATISWFLNFLARQIVTFFMAKVSEFLLIDYLSLTKRLTVRIFGPQFALLVVQSKGYPCVIFFWAFFDLLMLSGRSAFAKHWLFWQPLVKMWNDYNSAGTITQSKINFAILSCALGFGLFTAIKRLWLGLYLGKRTYNAYGEKLAQAMASLILVSEVATLSQDTGQLSSRASCPDIYDEAMSFCSSMSGRDMGLLGALPTERSSAAPRYQSMNMSQKQMVMEQLGAWEEPEMNTKKNSDVSIYGILQFRQALTFVDNNYLFSVAFGPADQRDSCIDSAQKVYDRLLLRQPEDNVLHFDVIATLAVNRDQSVHTDKLKALIRLFRPHRDGHLAKLDFLKSVDKVYKDFRLLQASIENSGSVDRSFEIMVNYAFFTLLWCVILWVIGLDPFALLLSLSAFIVGFAFCVGGASSKFFEGLLFILCRRPYDIGDRIHVSNPESDPNSNGSMTWFVEDLDLYSTTVRLAATNEVATYSNGSLAGSRVINAARSPLAVVSINNKFGVRVSYSKIKLFKRTVEQFIHERPREWVTLLAMRAGSVEQDQGYIQYTIVLQHRESWQNLGAILNSKADVTSFSLEVAKQLGMNYIAPPLPVNLTMTAANGEETSPNRPRLDTAASNTPGIQAISDMFGPRK